MKKLIIVTLLLIPISVFGHPGRTASDGCHYCRTNCAKWGEVANARHCHGGGSVPVPKVDYVTPVSVPKKVDYVVPTKKETTKTTNSYNYSEDDYNNTSDDESGIGAVLGVVALLGAGGVGLYRKFK